MSKSTIIKGTLILTITGLITRLIGFFYKIYLSNLMGAKNLGIYQLIFPIYGICFTLYASGIQTAISKLVAEETGKNKGKNVKKILISGIFLSVSIALMLSLIIYNFSDFIATRLLLEAECASSLRILALVFPFCGITACINGYYYGLKKAAVPALSQLLEQIVRVASVMLIVSHLSFKDVKTTCEIAVFGIVAGEIASQLYNLISLAFSKNKRSENNERLEGSSFLRKEVLKGRKYDTHLLNPVKCLIKTSAPLTVNRLLLSILHSFEAVLIPSMLKSYGMSSVEALSIYGILTGMAVPFIMFPSTITNSMSVLLLPAVSEAKARDNSNLIASTTAISVKYSLILGIFSASFFITFGKDLGMLVYNEPLAGIYLTIYAWICPFLYIATTLSSIINGLGKINLSFITSASFLGLRIILICILIPIYGIKGFFISFLISQLLLTLCDFIIVKKYTDFTLDMVSVIIKPTVILLISCGFYQKLYEFMQAKIQINNLILLLVNGIMLCITFIILMFGTNAVSIKELKKVT